MGKSYITVRGSNTTTHLLKHKTTSGLPCEIRGRRMMRPRSSFVVSLGYTKTGLKKKMFSQVNEIKKKEKKNDW